MRFIGCIRVRGLNDVYISQVALNQVEAFSDVGQHSHAGIVEPLRHVGDCFDYFFHRAIIFATAAIILQLFFFLPAPQLLICLEFPCSLFLELKLLQHTVLYYLVSGSVYIDTRTE